VEREAVRGERGCSWRERLFVEREAVRGELS